MNEQEAEHLVTQLQIAHRLCVGYYQRLLPRLNQLADEHDLAFWYWEPCHNDRPSQSKTAPGNKWAWDFVPLYAFRTVYWSVASDTAKVGDTAVAFNVYLDYNYHPDRRQELSIRGQPDPMNLPPGNALVEVIVYRCVADNGDSFEKLFRDVPWVTVEHEWQSCGACMRGIKLTFPLQKLFAQPEVITQAIGEVLQTVGHSPATVLGQGGTKG